MLDDNFFANISQQLTDEQKQKIAENAYSLLEERVGEKLADQLSDEQYQQFETVIAQGNELDLDEWLQKNAPGHEKLVDDNLDQIKREIVADPSKFLQ